MAMSEQEVLEKIEEAYRTGDTTLELTGEGLTRFPEEIGKLSKLKKLYLRGNQQNTNLLLPLQV